jgi:ABC-2 type transport system ATP-binding protein
LTGLDGVLDASLFGRVLRVVVSQAAGAQEAVKQCIERAGLSCNLVEFVAPTLEDVFVSRVRRAGGAMIS